MCDDDSSLNGPAVSAPTEPLIADEVRERNPGARSSVREAQRALTCWPCQSSQTPPPRDDDVLNDYDSALGMVRSANPVALVCWISIEPRVCVRGGG